MDTRYYTSAARITPGTRINVDGAGTLEVVSKTRQVNGLYRISTRELHGEHPCHFLDVYPARHVFHLAAHASDCETCAAAAPAEPTSWAVSTMNRAELAAFIGEAEAVRDYGLEVIAGRATGWTLADAVAQSDRAQLALNDLVDRGVI